MTECVSCTDCGGALVSVGERREYACSQCVKAFVVTVKEQLPQTGAD